LVIGFGFGFHFKPNRKSSFNERVTYMRLAGHRTSDLCECLSLSHSPATDSVAHLTTPSQAKATKADHRYNYSPLSITSHEPTTPGHNAFQTLTYLWRRVRAAAALAICKQGVVAA
jgi:hypothetical protein